MLAALFDCLFTVAQGNQDVMPHLQMGKLRCNDVKSPSNLSCVLGALYLNPACWIPRCQFSVTQDKEPLKEDFQDPQWEERALSSGNLQACSSLGGVAPVSMSPVEHLCTTSQHEVLWEG